MVLTISCRIYTTPMDSTAETSLQGFNHAMNSAYNQAQQFSQQTGNSNTMNTSTDDSQTAQATRGVSSMISAAKDYAKRHGISEQQAWAEIETKSRDAELEGHGGWSLSKSALGKAATAMGFDAGVSGKVSAKSGSQSSADQRQSGSTDHSSSEDAKNVRDFREGKQILQSYRVSHSAVRNDNSSASQLEQIGTTLSVADSQYQQYTSSVSRSHEYSKVASMSESETAQQTSNLSQEFVGYVQQKAPGDASRILRTYPKRYFGLYLIDSHASVETLISGGFGHQGLLFNYRFLRLLR